jgi:hypothetical protein
MELPVVEKLLPASRKMRAVVATDESGERALPVNGEPFEPFEKLTVQNGSVCQGKPRLYF